MPKNKTLNPQQDEISGIKRKKIQKTETIDQKKNFKVAPSGLDYALKCKRCLWLSRKGIKLDAFFPPIFNAFDLIQKKFLITQSVKLMSDALPEGRIMTELNGFIGSSTLKDKKGRPFIISGKTDVVVEFNTTPKKYGIIDLKTTNINPSKIENYKFQLESYATIFQNPNLKTPKLSNIEELGLYLFEPKEITNISNETCNMNFETLYLKGNRCHDELINRITEIIDIYLMKKPPDYNPVCSSCKFVTSLKKEKYI
jgi:CRISPR/Cas system-associated exonuclease Cas4 (RecB family)|tara:strand:+ start:26 stop:793 length:768 start_codon:yes stop_codon:yes gene_type:complete